VLNRLRAVFSCLHSNEVRCVVIGGVAAVLHGVPRATFDLDLLIEPSEPNGVRLLKALEEAGLGTAALIDARRLLAHEITIFKDRVRVDVMTSTPGLAFEDVMASKRAAGRAKDLEDVRVLELRRDPDEGR
jgi:hypothetical protein